MKSGLCPEDCHYCSQRRDSTADILKYPMVDEAVCVEAADRAVAAGAKRLCMVASGRGPTPHELEQVTANVRAVKAKHPELEICACLGLLAEGHATQLKEAGVYAYNHNLNTSEKHYDAICGTHTFADRIETVGRVAAEGLSPCSGALFGMGESHEDIVDLAFDLRRLQPDSVPVNFLIPIDGTPLKGRWELTPQRCLRILALYRFFFPDVELRIAGGRELHLRSLQPFGLMDREFDLRRRLPDHGGTTRRDRPADDRRPRLRDRGDRRGHAAAPKTRHGALAQPGHWHRPARQRLTRPKVVYLTHPRTARHSSSLLQGFLCT